MTRRPPSEPPDTDALPEDRGRPLGLRLLALLGALSFVMLGLNTVLPLLRMPPPPPPMPDRDRGLISGLVRGVD